MCVIHPFLSGATLQVHMWRCAAAHKVWYEWAAELEGGQAGPIHNPNGRSYYVGL